jgi:hypothetical protein
VLRGWLTEFDVEDRCPPNLHPRTLSKSSDGFDCGFVEGFGFDVAGVANAEGSRKETLHVFALTTGSIS